MAAVKVQAFGDSKGVLLPEEALEELNLKVGDTVHVVRTPEGLLLTAKDPNHDRQVELGEKFIEKYPNALRDLAK